MSQIVRTTRPIFLTICFALASLCHAAPTTPKASPKVKQVPSIMNGKPVPLSLVKLLSRQEKGDSAAKDALAGGHNSSHFTGTFSAQRNILVPLIKAVQNKVPANGPLSSSQPKTHATPAAATSNSTVNFPGFSGTPFVAGASSTDTSATYTTVAADINKDGKQDIVVVQSDGAINVLLNPGTSNAADWKITSSNTTAVLNPSVYYFQAVAVDLNGDGYPDLEVTDLVNNAEFVYMNNKQGGFLDPVENDISFSTGTVFNGYGGGVVVADVNGDGFPDLVSVGFYQYYDNSGANTTVSILTQLGTGSGTFAAPLAEQTTTVAASLQSDYAQITYGDLNKDGKLDLVIPVLGYENGPTESFIEVLTGNGDGTFSAFDSALPTTGAVLPLNDAGYGSHYVADIDGDGNPDVIYSPETLGTLWLARGNGDGTLQTPVQLLSNLGNYNNGGAPVVNFADVNGDGNVDVIAYNYGYVSVFLNKGKGVFDSTPLVQLVSGSGGITQPLPADFNNDGQVDFAMVDATSSHIGFYPGTKGTFAGAPMVAPTGETATGFLALGVGDFNGDGSPDILAQDSTNESASTYYPDLVIGTNDGKGNFSYKTAISADILYAANIGTVYPVTVDLNGDGTPDIIFSSYSTTLSGYEMAISFSQSDKTFSQPVPLALGVGLGCRPNYIDAGDLNGDGYKDIVVAYEGDSTCSASGSTAPGVFILLNDGKGNFTTSFMAYGYAPSIPKLIDFNGDGKLDLALSDAQDTDGFYYLYVIPGNGDGTFNQAGAQYALESAVVTSIIPGDFDGDGIQDLTVGVEAQVDGDDNPIVSTTGTYLMKGNGDFTFQQPVIYGMGTYPYGGVYADLNGDGKPDLVLSEGTLDYYTNIYTPSFVYFENLGGGALLPGPQSFGPATKYSGQIFAADFNGDGAVDVLSGPEVEEGYNDVYSSDLFLNAGGDSLSLTASTPSTVQNQSVTLTATISSSVNTGTPTGTVTFYDNGVVLEASQLSGPSASIALTSLPVGTNAITAKYSGDGSFNAATANTSVAVQIAALPPAFTLSAPAISTLSLAEGQSGSVSFPLTSNATFTGAVTFSCSGAPSESTCTVFPSSVTLSGTQSTSISVVVATTPPNNTSAANRRMKLWESTGGIGVAGFTMLMWPTRKRRIGKLLVMSLVLVLGGAVSTALTGCGGSGYKYPGTPVGSSVITVTATSGALSQTQTFTLSIAKQ